MDTAAPTNTPPKPNKFNLSLDYRFIVLLLLAVIAAMLILWRPWQTSADANSRTVKVTGETTLKAEPDEYVFMPSYQFKNADKAAAIKAAQDKQAEIVAGLKALQVSDKQIKTNIDGYSDMSRPLPYGGGEAQFEEGYQYTLTATVTTAARSKAQQIQDYLAATEPLGQVTPQVTFSEAARKRLESQARDAASKDARAKADQSAKNLGFEVKGVKSVEDGTGFGNIFAGCGPGGLCSGVAMKAEDSSTSISVQPGQNDLPYSVTVTYYIQ